MNYIFSRKRIERNIKTLQEELCHWQLLLREYVQQEYELRRGECLEVESDRHDYERARKALEILRGVSKDD